jgi:hypothetical protein
MSRITILFLVVLAVAPRVACAASTPTLFRLFLNDGSALVSYGEYARVSDRVVFSMPVGGAPDEPRLEVVSIPAASVDWMRTDAYAQSARYQQYAATRGEDDYEALTSRVADVLNQIAISKDPGHALAMAQQVRQMLVAWPRSHYGYRQDDVREIVALLDDAIAGLRAATGASPFNLSLFATVPQIRLEPVKGMPTAREELDQIFHLASTTDRPSDRVALLESALALLHDGGTGYRPLEVEALRRHAEQTIRNELEVDASYSKLASRLLTDATKAAADARVADVEHVVDRVAGEDAKLGHRRPDTIQALRASLKVELETARRLRLLRDRWHLRQAQYRRYEEAVGGQIAQLVKAEPLLEAIRRLEGPPLDRLRDLRSDLRGGAERLTRMPTTSDLQGAHDLFVTAWRFAEHAADLRYQAVASGDLKEAWQASSSAAAALLTLARAQQELRTFLEPPHVDNP